MQKDGAAGPLMGKKLAGKGLPNIAPKCILASEASKPRPGAAATQLLDDSAEIFPTNPQLHIEKMNSHISEANLSTESKINNTTTEPTSVATDSVADRRKA